MAKRESGTVSTRGIGVPKFNQEMLAATIAALAGITLVWTFSQPAFPVPVLIAAGAVFTVSMASCTPTHTVTAAHPHAWSSGS